MRTDWFFMIATDMEEILKPLLDLKIKIAFVSLLLITISVMVAVFMSRSLSRPLKKLALGVARFEGGRLADCIRIQGIPELENLAHAFNKMAKRRLRIEKDLSRAREKLEERVEERTAELLRTNVSLQKEMKERREVEDRLHSLFQNSLTGIAQHELLFDENGAPADFRVIDVNPAYTRILGITRDEAVGAKA
ncbi:MAG: HAMP domain-containing protein, partial [Desulfobacterales bacterium]|nr:HAMP domain-containing protein [Desulfobacterales bacterium]